MKTILFLGLLLLLPGCVGEIVGGAVGAATDIGVGAVDTATDIATAPLP